MEEVSEDTILEAMVKHDLVVKMSPTSEYTTHAGIEAIEFCPNCGTPLGMKEKSVGEARAERLAAMGQEGRSRALEYDGDPIEDLHRVLTDCATQPEIDFYVPCDSREEKTRKPDIGLEVMRHQVSLELDDDDINAIEDSFFYHLTDGQAKTIWNRLCRIWNDICFQVDAQEGKEMVLGTGAVPTISARGA